ncbi:hypothetical protein CF328_g7196 [Tilletia controversa]|nr:hypothetical protein CF328_g7196 [Tilletia controversa]
MRGPMQHFVSSSIALTDQLASKEDPNASRHTMRQQNAILLLPPTALAAVRDVDSAFRLIPLHPSQWPGTVLHDNDDRYYIDFCLGFGISPAPGAWGLVADALADLLRRSGLGVVVKWVDDFLFLTIPLQHMATTNQQLLSRSRSINPTPVHVKGALFFADQQGNSFSDDGRGQYKNLTNTTNPTSPITSLAAIDIITSPLGIPWKAAKDKDFAPIQKYVGFNLNIPARTVSLPESKRLRYLANVNDWLTRAKHTPHQAEELLGRLEHSSFVHTTGRKRLAYLRMFLRLAASSPRHIPRFPPRQLSSDIEWWQSALQSPDTARSFHKDQAITDLQLYTDASGDWGIGVTLDSSQLSLPFWQGAIDQGRGIVWAELLAFEIGLRVAIEVGVQDTTLIIHTDNEAVIASVQSGFMRNEQAMVVLQRIRQLEARYNLELKPIYIPSLQNPADPPSRGFYTTHHRLPIPPLDPSTIAYFSTILPNHDND